MAEQRYQLDGFVDVLLAMDPLAVQPAIEAELSRVEDAILRGPALQHRGGAGYSRRLGALLMILKQGVRPAGASNGDMRLFEPLVDTFIARGLLDEGCRSRLGYPERRA